MMKNLLQLQSFSVVFFCVWTSSLIVEAHHTRPAPEFDRRDDRQNAFNPTNIEANSRVSSDYRHHNRQERNSMQNFGPTDFRVPFWNIAHMINSIEQVQVALSEGANGIETDISFDKSGTPVESYHGFPCDCGRHCHFREDLVKFVQHLARITSPTSESNMNLALFDLKLKDLDQNAKSKAGTDLAEILNRHLYSPYQKEFRQSDFRNSIVRPPLRIIISINHVGDSQLVESFLNYVKVHRLKIMQNFVGFDVGMNDNLTDISEMWSRFRGEVRNIWQGDGLTNCANLVRGVERLKEAIETRNNQGYFKKIYYWTVDVMYQVRTVLRFGLDAVLTNQPQRVVQVLEEPEFRNKFRLATVHDDPFLQFRIQPTAWEVSIPTIGEAVETVTNIRETSENFFKSIPDGLKAALKKIQHSIGL